MEEFITINPYSVKILLTTYLHFNHMYFIAECCINLYSVLFYVNMQGTSFYFHVFFISIVISFLPCPCSIL